MSSTSLNATATGTWRIVPSKDVFAGYRVVQMTSGIEQTRVGRTPVVAGTVTIEGTTLRSVEIGPRRDLV